MNEETTNLQLYLNQMELIKLRQSVISNIICKKNTTGYKYSDIEICVLEIRKIIELIAMGSMVSNIDKYSEIHDKYQHDWNARYIFNDIERINPSFYPEPIEIDKSGPYDKFITVSTDYLSKDDAIKVYDKCNAFLHEDNPFKEKHDTTFYESNIPIWNGKIVKLLNTHLVHLYDDKIYYIVMKSDIDGKTRGSVFEPVNTN